MVGNPVYTTYFFGDSYTRGQGASVVANNWVSLVGNNKSLEFSNKGQDGRAIEPGAAVPFSSFDLSTVPLLGRYNKGIVAAWGINDSNTSAFPSGNTTTYTTAWTNFFNQCISNGWGYNQITVISQYYIPTWTQAAHPNYDAYASALQTLCTSLGIKWINCKAYMVANGGDTLFFNGGPNDGHPNDTGYSVIATYIESQL